MKTRKVVCIGEYMTLPAAGQAIGRTYWELRGLIRRGQVETLKLGGTLLVRVADVEKAGQYEQAHR